MTPSEHTFNIRKFSETLSLETGLQVPAIFHRTQVPALNGLRALAIFFVLADHLRYGLGCPRIFYTVNSYLSLGSFGVQLFFVLSGFLITGLLLREKVHSGSIGIPKFWLRRALRILPAFYFYLLVIMLLARLNVAAVNDKAIVAAAFFVSNIGNWHSQWLVVHSWTLAVEEQFYLGLPLLITFLPRKYYWAGILIVVYYLFYYYLRNYPFLFPLRFFLVPAIPLLSGALLATAMYKGWLNSIHSRLTHPVAALSLVLGMLTYLPRTFQFMPLFYRPFDYLVSSVFIAAFIYYAIHGGRKNWISRILNLRVMSYIGVLSYSLYLWQQPFLSPAFSYQVFPYWTVFPWNLAATLMAALISHYLIERPFLKLKKQFERPIYVHSDQSRGPVESIPAG